MTQTCTQRPSLVVLAVIGALWAAYAANAFLTPLTLALFILALAWPIQLWLQARLPVGLAVLLTLGAVVVVAATLSSATLWAFGTLWRSISTSAELYQKHYQNAVDWLEGHGIAVAGLWGDNVNVGWVLRVVQQLLSRMSQTMTFWVVVLAYLITGLVEVAAFRRSVLGLQDTRIAAAMLAAVSDTAEKLRRYMWVRTAMSLLSGAAVWLLALIAGVPFAFEWGVIGFTLNFIPFIGPLVATVLPSWFVLVQMSDPATAAMFFGAITLLQFLIGNYVEPKISGDALRLSPFIVLVAIFLWSFLWGIYGTFIGVPIAIAAASFAARFNSSRWFSQLMGETSTVAGAGTPTPVQTL
jgi:predicted PurR-regulated permease PerM